MLPCASGDRLQRVQAAFEEGACVVVWAYVRPGWRHEDRAYTRLSAAEKKRAAAFRFESDRKTFIASRALLARLVYAAYGRESEIIRFSAARPGGKPELEISSGRYVFANISHTSGFVIAALHASVDVGVDVEAGREPLRGVAGLSALTMTRREQLAILANPLPEALFYRLWVRKEAVLKALGSGFSEDPRGVDVLNTSEVLLPSRLGCLMSLIDLHETPHSAAVCILGAAMHVYSIELDINTI